MAGDIYSLLLALLCLLWAIGLWIRRHHTSVSRSSAPALRQRLLKPRTPDDCPTCRCQHARPAAEPALPPVPRPWRELKS